MEIHYNLIAFQAHVRWEKHIPDFPFSNRVCCSSEGIENALKEIEKAHLEDSDEVLKERADNLKTAYDRELENGKNIELFYIFKELYEAALEHRLSRKHLEMFGIQKVNGIVKITCDTKPVGKWYKVELTFEANTEDEEFKEPSQLGSWECDDYDEAFGIYETMNKQIEPWIAKVDDSYEAYDVYRLLCDFIWKISSDREEAKMAELQKRVSQGMAEMAQYKIMSEAIKNIKGTADDLWDTGDEEIANHIYLAVIDLVKGKDALAQYIQAKIIDETKERGIALSDEQLEEAILRTQLWVQNHARNGMQEIIKEVMWSGNRESAAHL